MLAEVSVAGGLERKLPRVVVHRGIAGTRWVRFEFARAEQVHGRLRCTMPSRFARLRDFGPALD